MVYGSHTEKMIYIRKNTERKVIGNFLLETFGSISVYVLAMILCYKALNFCWVLLSNSQEKFILQFNLKLDYNTLE